jgi:hypothetical protein
MDTVPQIKTCCDCGYEKQSDDFYKRPDGKNLNSVCKDCMKKRSAAKKINNTSKMISTVDSENLVLSKLHSMGIPALPGKAISHSWTDIVAWGIVRIEVKYAIMRHDGQYIWTFSPTQTKKRVKGDVIVLIGRTEMGNAQRKHRYFILPSNSEVFYKDGHRKKGVSFPLSRLSMENVNTEIENSEDNWGLVNQMRDSFCRDLREGVFDFIK